MSSSTTKPRVVVPRMTRQTSRLASNPAATAVPSSSRSRAPRKRKVVVEEEDEEDEEEEDEEEDLVMTEPEDKDDQTKGKGKSTTRKPTTTTTTIRKPTVSKVKRAKLSSVNDDDEDDEDDAKPVTATTRTGRVPRPAPPRANLRDTNFKPLLAERWDLDNGRDVRNWHCSEKLDGVRAYWTGTRFQSREGNPFYAPAWFTKRLPTNITLDGELFTERGGFQECVSIVRTQGGDGKRWKFKVTYEIFDVPSMGHLPFEKRIEFAKDLFENKLRIKWVNVVAQTRVRSDFKEHVHEMLEDVLKSGGEGLMLREPGSKYVQGRSHTLLKVKKFYDADAIVRGHEQGSGKNSAVVGALRCEMMDPVTGKGTGKMFKVGSGLTDAQRRKPPKVGAVIIYKYQELSKSGSPRFPTYVGERAD